MSRTSGIQSPSSIRATSLTRRPDARAIIAGEAIRISRVGHPAISRDVNLRREFANESIPSRQDQIRQWQLTQLFGNRAVQLVDEEVNCLTSRHQAHLRRYRSVQLIELKNKVGN